METTDMYVRAARLCSKSEHCTAQVREKLFAWGATADEADAVISRLVEERFIDNLRFARAYCHDKFLYSHWGRVKISQMLRHLRLCDEEIREGLAVIPEEEYRQALLDTLRQKDRTLHETDAYRRRGKLIRHLLSRGFEMELAVKALDE